MNITEQQLRQILPRAQNLGNLCQVLNKLLPRYGINTTNRVAGFLAQCGVESADFTVFIENLNYSSQALVSIFGSHFHGDADQYAYQPEKIANRIYANRLGNGDESSGDGYRYRGRGAIQLTGHDNYTLFASSIGLTLVDITNYLTSLQGAVEVACWFWKCRSVNAACDADNIDKMTRLINGGTNGLDQRHEKYETAKRILEGVKLC